MYSVRDLEHDQHDQHDQSDHHLHHHIQPVSLPTDDQGSLQSEVHQRPDCRHPCHHGQCSIDLKNRNFLGLLPKTF